MGTAVRIGAAFVVMAAALCVWNLAERRLAHPQPQQTKTVINPDWERAYGGKDVRITMFYARDAISQPGKGTLLCYGVVNAKSARIEPTVEAVYPAVSRCVPVVPQRETKYTLYAEGGDGRVASQSLTLSVR